MKLDLSGGFSNWRRQLGKPGKFLLGLVVCVLGVGVVVWMLYRGREDLQGLKLSLDLQTGLLPVLLYGLSTAVAVLAFASLMNQLGSEVSLRKHGWIYYVSVLTGKVPIPLAHVLGRVALYSEAEDRRAVPLASALELLYCALAGLVLALAFSPAGDQRMTWPSLIGALVLGVVLLHPSTARWLARKLKLRTATLGYRNMLTWLAMYLLLQFFIGLLLFSTIQWVHPLAWTALPQVLAISGLVTVARAATLLLPQRFGVAEAGLSVLLATLLPGGLAALVAVLYALLFSLLDVVFGGLALAIGKGEETSKPPPA